jgi:hypothetical protein
MVVKFHARNVGKSQRQVSKVPEVPKVSKVSKVPWERY